MDKDHKCGNCLHFMYLDDVGPTGICDEERLNKVTNIPAVLTDEEDACWKWEADYGYEEEEEDDDA